MDMYGFYTGKEFNAYKFQGAHLEKEGTIFRTFAPNAQKISVIGDFNQWQEIEMEKVCDGNFYECYIAGAKEGMRYKYRIYKKDGSFIDHCDPYGFGMELRPNTASIIRDLSSYSFHDEKWIKERNICQGEALNIYEMHLGSWRKNQKEEHGWFTYQEIAKLLIPYLKKNGYNYVEFMPLSEHPCDESWGYQNTGFFSPTARYGTGEGLMELVDQCHQNEIGVILDFVPVHFAIDDYGLACYDGTCLYEYPNTDVGVSEWGSHNFIHSRGEVRSFLQSAVNYWLTEYHFDGIRMDAISRIIYWQGEPRRGVNGNAVEFIKHMNEGLKERHPSVLLTAEDSTDFPNVTKPVSQGGLGFDYKWDMGWMNDTLNYFRTSPKERTQNYHKLTFSMMYYYKERYLLPLSHDEVVHGKATILQKMYGDYEGKFSQARAFYMYMYAHPGKKLNFMGNEIGQLREWDEKREQDWEILKYPKHDAFHQFLIDLHHFYLRTPAMWMWDDDPKGFQWLDCHQEEKCIYAFERKAADQTIVAVFNFSDQKREYALPIKEKRRLKLVMNSDWEQYDGQSEEKENNKVAEKEETFLLNIPEFSALYFLEEKEEI